MYEPTIESGLFPFAHSTQAFLCIREIILIVQKIIKLFMWGYQGHFRWSLEHKARNVLQTVAPLVEPLALLVGIRTPEYVDGHPVCVEPEDEEWDPSIFFGCHKRAEEI